MYENPKLSILIPTYNYGEYLSQAVKSILSQSFSDFEILISDNASTDNTHHLVKELSTTDNRIGYFCQPVNIGMVANWNWCLQNAKGEYVLFLFADDYFLSENALEALVNTLNNNQKAAIAVSRRLCVEKDGHPRMRADDLGKAGYYSASTAINNCWRTSANLIGEPSAVLIRKSATNRGFLGELKQLVDFEMWLHCLSQGDLVLLDDTFVALRQHDQQQTALNRKDKNIVLEMFLIYKNNQSKFIPKTKKWSQLLAYYQGLYTVMHFLNKSNSKDTEILGAINYLTEEIIPPWCFLAPIAFQIQKTKTKLHRSLKKRRFLLNK